MEFHTFDLLICLRCHTEASFVEDTLDSILEFTDRETTLVMCAVDGRPNLAKRLSRILPGRVYCSETKWGWGVGLYGLLAESILWSKARWKYSHFLSVDYDTLFIEQSADQLFLDHVTEPELGLVGEYNVRNIHWEAIFKEDKARIKAKIGSIPRGYHPGEGVQGGAMLLTCSFLQELIERRMLVPPFSNARNFTRLADDHLIPLYCRMCNLEIAQVSPEVHVRWHLDCDPIGLEKKNVKVFHPTKIRPDCRDRNIELRVRNYYRKLRGKGPLV